MMISTAYQSLFLTALFSAISIAVGNVYQTLNVIGDRNVTIPTNGIPQRLSVYDPYRGVNCQGYQAVNISESQNGVTAYLALLGEPCYAYGTDYPLLFLNVTYEEADRVHISIKDANNTQFQFTSRKDLWDAPLYSPSYNNTNLLYNFSYNANPFEFWVTRKSDGEVLFDTRGQKLVFEDQYIELTTNMVENYNLYGLAETIHGLRLGNNLTRTFWANDEASPVDQNMYGSHPYYLEQRYKADGINSTLNETTYTSSSHGVLMLTANGMDVLLRQDYLQYRMIGGVIDLFVYSGSTESPKETVKQFVQSIGKPAMHQYWTLGYHSCRWGYTNITEIMDVRQNYIDADIPVETFWSDIDYMEKYRDFTVDPVSYSKSDMQTFFSDLVSNHQHYVPIIDAAIYAANPYNHTDDSYYPYYAGVEKDIFLKNPNGSIYIGAVWPGFTAFPDFTNPDVVDYWKDCLINLTYAFGSNGTVPFSGIWTDMNEPSSFCVGSCGSAMIDLNPAEPLVGISKQYSIPEGFNVSNVTEYSSAYSASLSNYYATATSSVFQIVSPTATPLGLKPDYNINWPPYAINNEQGNHDIANHIVSPNATTHDGTQRYDIFNMYGYGETKVSYAALTQISPNERPFILSRSTFLGSGVYGAHWLGDNHSLWSNMFFSISGMIVFNMMGIPMVGADVCGFLGDSDEELCSRWMAMGAFSPFYRNHNNIYQISQEPYTWSSVAEASRRAMYIRYSLLPYWYTIMAKASQDGTPALRALFVEFPNDPTLADVDRQFMVGDSLLVTPVLEPNVEYVQGVFPGDNSTVWYDWYNHTEIVRQYNENVTLYAPLEHINVAIRGGSVLPMQQPSLTTYESRQNPFNLLVALDRDGSATGELYLDDGVSIELNATLSVSFTFSDGVLSAVPTGSYEVSQPLANVTILGLTESPSSITLNGQNVSSFQYSNDTEELLITGLQNITSSGAFANSWNLTL
nr:alpha-glucosidase [Schizosaccharomyces pombe]